VPGSWSHGNRLQWLERYAGQCQVVVAVVLAQLDETANVGSCGHQFVVRLALVGEGKKHLAIHLLAGERPGMADGDVANLE
jgi:hypothetical protein